MFLTAPFGKGSSNGGNRSIGYSFGRFNMMRLSATEQPWPLRGRSTD